MSAQKLISFVMVAGVCWLLWRFFFKELVMSFFPAEEVVEEETPDKLRQRIADKQQELSELERDAASLSSEVRVTREVSAKRKEIGKLTRQLEKLDEGMPENPLDQEDPAD